MAEKFIVVWTVDGETTSAPYPTQDRALQQAERLLRERGCDLEITLHLNQISPPPSVLFNKKKDAGLVSRRVPGRSNLNGPAPSPARPDAR
jgi:hypothetical protein